MIIPEPLKAIRAAFQGKTQIKATFNQRYLDHDSQSAKSHIKEIEEFGIDNLKKKNYVKDNNLSISFGGAIFLRELKEEIWACPDGISRKNKISTIIFCTRDGASNKDKFDSFIFDESENNLRLTYLDESATYIDSNYTQVNDIVKYLSSDIYGIDYVLKNYQESIYSQRHYYLEQLKEYHIWINSIDFKNDDERINFINNILDLHNVIWVNSLNDVKSFIHNSQETRKDSNGIDLSANKIMSKIESKYEDFNDEDRLKIEEVIKKQISYGFSPIRMHDKPTEDNVTSNWISQIMLSYKTDGRGRPKTTTQDTKHLDTVINEIFDDINAYIHNDCIKYFDGEGSFQSIISKIETSIKENKYVKDVIKLHDLKSDSILRDLRTFWFPFILKFERNSGRKITENEKLFISFLDLCDDVTSDLWTTIQYWKEEVLSDIDKSVNSNTKISLSSILSRNLIYPTSTDSNSNFGNTSFSEILAKDLTFQEKKGWNKPTNKDYKSISQFDKLLGHLSLKGNIKNWFSIQKGFKHSDTLITELEHFLSRKGQTQSDVIKTILNLWHIQKSDNSHFSNKPINEKIELLKSSGQSSLSFLFHPVDNLDDDIKDLLTSDEYKKEFGNTNFNDEDWIRICSVGRKESSESHNNLIYKYRKLQIDNLLKKIHE